MAPSTPVINADIAPVLKHLVQFNPSSQLPIKLCGSHNFTIWKAQIAMLLHGHDLYGLLDGTKLSPPETVTTDGLVTANPEYKDWFRQDKLTQNALMASVDATIASTVASAANSKAAWDQLHTSFANKSQTRIFSLRHHLSRVSKDTKSIVEYMREIRSLSDELATACSPINNEELVVKILSGLGPEFREISAATRARDLPISYAELFNKLLDYELFLKHEDLKRTTTHVTTSVAQRVTNTSSAQRNNHRCQPTNNNGHPPNRPHNQSAAFQHPNDYSQGRNFPHQSSRIRCQLCDKFGHTTNVCRSRSHNHFEAKTNFVVHTMPNDPWIVDSGASHHIAADTNYLHNVQDFKGAKEVTLGNGNVIPITQTAADPTIPLMRDTRHDLCSLRTAQRTTPQSDHFITDTPGNLPTTSPDIPQQSSVVNSPPPHFIFQSPPPALSTRPLPLHGRPPIIPVYRRRPTSSPNIPTQAPIVQSTNLSAYVDADWAGDINDHRSISGYIIFLGTTPISWCSRKQPTVSRSSTKAEYRAVASALSETNWITHLLKDLHMPLSAVPTILCDNLGVTYIAENPVHHTKMKHLEVDLHFGRNQVRNGLVQVSHVHSADQIADPLTKPLSKTAFQRMLPKLRVVSSHIP
ncbi:hypothetical protein KY284_035694 [Solanum tuberosum]|nr:hypothetical protein KY284_035694 [Solanum tuberosum]